MMVKEQRLNQKKEVFSSHANNELLRQLAHESSP